MAKEQVSESSDLSAILPYLLKSFFPEKISSSGSESGTSGESTITGANIGPLLKLLQQMNPDLVAEQAKEGVNYQTDRLLQSNFAPYLAAVNASGGYNTGNQFLAQLLADTAGQGAKLSTDARLEAGKTSEAAARDVATNTRTTETNKTTNNNTQQQQKKSTSPDFKSLATSLLLSSALKKGGNKLWDTISNRGGETGPEQLSGPTGDTSLGGISEGHGGTGSSDVVNSSTMTDEAFGGPGVQTDQNVFSPDIIPDDAFLSTSPEAISEALNAVNSPVDEIFSSDSASALNSLKQNPDETFSSGTQGENDFISSTNDGGIPGSAGEDSIGADTSFGLDDAGEGIGAGEGAGIGEGIGAAGEAEEAGELGSSIAEGVAGSFSPSPISIFLAFDSATDGDLHRGAEETAQLVTDNVFFNSEWIRDNTDPSKNVIPTDWFSNGAAPEEVAEYLPVVSDAGTVVCTEALKQGLMSKELYAVAHRAVLGRITRYGYHFVAAPIVLKMRKDSKFAKLAAKWAIAYCEYSIGKKRSVVGFSLYWIARPICTFIGLIVGPQDIDEILYHG